jgi:hypothetical protein
MRVSDNCEAPIGADWRKMKMERLWFGDVKMKYPKQWIVFVNISHEPKNRAIGDVYLVTSDRAKAYETAKSLGKSMGSLMVVEGFNDTPQIGGFTVCSQ